MVDISQIEWEWWALNETPQLIEVVFENLTGEDEITFLDTAFIRSYLSEHEPALYLAFLQSEHSNLKELFLTLDWDADTLVRDMVCAQSGINC